jgi:maltose alpha-D-glucosyltransferase/alpha-amylase
MVIRRLSAEQSNSSMILGDAVVLKIIRKISPGIHPEAEMTRHLTAAGFGNTAPLLGEVVRVAADGTPHTLMLAQGFVRNQGDAWSVVLDALGRDLDETALTARDEAGQAESAARSFSHPLDIGLVLGKRTAELHAAFATPTDDPAFATEPAGADDISRWVDAAVAQAERAFTALDRASLTLPDDAREDVRILGESRPALLDRLQAMRGRDVTGLKTRTHGDYHLGQVLIAQNDVMIVDFEGEPGRELDERRHKTSPLRDVAGMLRSFDYAAVSALDALRARRGQLEPELRQRARAWRDQATRDFLGAYWPTAERAGLVPNAAELGRNLLDLFLLEKAFYEINYEAANRPAWISIPVRGILDLIAPPAAST